MLGPIGVPQTKTNWRPMCDAALDVFSITYRAADHAKSPGKAFRQVRGSVNRSCGGTDTIIARQITGRHASAHPS